MWTLRSHAEGSSGIDSILASEVDSIGIPLLSNHTIMTTVKLYSDDHCPSLQWWPLCILTVMTTVYPYSDDHCQTVQWKPLSVLSVMSTIELYSDDHWELVLCMGEDTSQQVGSPNFYLESMICATFKPQISFLVYHELMESHLSLSSRASIRDTHRHT